MNPSLIDADLLRRHDVPGPRYTSYPTAPHFHAGFGENELREAALASNGDPIPRPLSLYVHVPFCADPCFYCGCNRIITRDRARAARYATHLKQEIDLLAPLFDADREVIQLHFGGGTPNFLSPAQLAELVAALRRRFRFSEREDRDISIELDPRTVSVEDIAALADTGFNRASLGVQDFDPVVQAAVNRIQGVDATDAIVRACRAQGFRSVNIDLIYGLPRQTAAGFGRTLDTVIAMRPDRIALYGYAHLPAMFKAQRRIDAADLPDAEGRLSLLMQAIEAFTAADYDYIGMDHFALPGDALARARAEGCLHRNFMGYTTHAESDLVGLGVSAIGRIGETFSQNAREIPAWEAALDAGRLPVARGLRVDEDDLLRADIIQAIMCQGELDIAAIARRHRIDFPHYFSHALQRLAPLADDGLLTLDSRRISVTPRGRLLLRRIAMCFDRYLDHAAAAAPALSRVV